MKGKILYSYFPGGPWYDPAGTTSGRDWSLAIECPNPMSAESLVNLRKDILQIYPWGTARLDGRWPVISDNSVILAQLDIFHDAALIKTSEISKNAAHVRVGESLLALNGGWVLGLNGIITLTGGHIRKAIDIATAPVSLEVDVTRRMDIALDYPWETLALDGTWAIGLDGRLYGLDGIRMDGTWAVGGIGQDIIHGRLAQKDILCDARMAKAVEVQSTLIAVGLGEACLRLDGGWVVGINGAMIFSDGLIYKDLALNGKWSVSAGNNILLSATGWRTSV